YYKQLDGAFVVYIQGDKWRFSYISEITKRNEDGNLVDEKTEPKRYTYVLGKGETVRTAIDRFIELLFKDVTLSDIKDTFSIEKITSEFYNKISYLFTSLVGGERSIGNKLNTFKRQLKLPSTNDVSKHQEFAVRLIGRIIFCWFLK